MDILFQKSNAKSETKLLVPYVVFEENVYFPRSPSENVSLHLLGLSGSHDYVQTVIGHREWEHQD